MNRLLHIIFKRFLIIVVLVLSSLTTKAHINDFLSHKTLLEKVEDSILLDEISFIENNWFCIENRQQRIDSLILSCPEHSNKYYFLNLWKIYDCFLISKTTECITHINTLFEKENLIFEGRFHYLLAKIYLQQKDYANSYGSLKLSEKYFLSHQDTIGQIYINTLLLKYFGQIGDFEMTNKYYHNALLLCEQYGYEDGLIMIYRAYASFVSLNDQEQAKELFEKGWQLARKNNETIRIRYAVAYLKFLIRYGYVDLFDRVYAKIQLECKSTCNLSNCSVISTIYAHKMSQMGFVDSAIYYNNQALRRRKLSGEKSFIGYSYLNLFNNYLELNKIPEARANLDSAESYLISVDNIEATRHFLKYKLRFFETTDHKDSIIEIYKELYMAENEYYSLQEYVYGSKIKAEYQVQYKLEKEKHESELGHSKEIFIYVVIISILLLIILVRVFSLFINRSRKVNVLKMKSKVNFITLDEYKHEIKQLKNIFENAITGFFILDKDLNIKYINKRAELIISTEESQIINRAFVQLFAEQYREDILLNMPEVINDFKNFEIQVKLGNTVQDQHINLSFSPMIINNEIESILVIALDISNRVQSLEIEKNQKTVLQTLFNSVTESIILMDGEGTIELVNDTGAKRLGKTVEELIGANYYDILPITIKSERVQKITQSLEQKKPIIYAENIDSYNTMVSIYPSFEIDGKVNYIAEFTQDITDRKLAYQQINSLRQKVLRSQMNPHFIFNSLNAIQSYVLKNDSEHAVKYLNSFARLIRMILDSSRFDYINLEKEISILEYYLQLQQLRFGDKFIWTMKVDKNIDTNSVLIPAMLAQPFIENAIEHGLQHLDENGIVKISFDRVQDNIVFKVTDNGIGREASKSMKLNLEKENESLSIKIFNERLFTLNKYSGQKITYEIVDLKDEEGNASGTSVIINLPIIYSSHLA